MSGSAELVSAWCARTRRLRLTPGAFPAPRTVVLCTLHSVVDRLALPVPARTGGDEEAEAWMCWWSGAPVSTSARTRWSPACGHPGRERQGPAQADPDVPVVHRRAGGDGRLVRRRGRDRGGDGSDRLVLEAGLVRARGAGVRAASWSTPSTSRSSPAARATSSTPSGWPSCSSTGCCGAASCRRRRSGSCGT